MEVEKEESALSAYVESLSRAYLLLRQRQKPSHGHLSLESMKLVETVAKQLCARRADPYAFVQFAYDRCFEHTTDVYPAMVFSLKAVTLYFEEQPQRRDEVNLLLRLQAQQVQDRLSHGLTLREILTDKLCPLSPVFRFASAWASGNFDIADTFKKDASNMLLFEPLYVEFLAESLPEEMLNGYSR